MVWGRCCGSAIPAEVWLAKQARLLAKYPAPTQTMPRVIRGCVSMLFELIRIFPHGNGQLDLWGQYMYQHSSHSLLIG